jgi:hypothetical protein
MVSSPSLFTVSMRKSDEMTSQDMPVTTPDGLAGLLYSCAQTLACNNVVYMYIALRVCRIVRDEIILGLLWTGTAF